MNGLDFGTAIGLIKGLGSPDPAVIESAVSDWLDDHPEATTTVQDGSITKAKLDSNLQGTVDDVANLKSQLTQKLDNIVPYYTNLAPYLYRENTYITNSGVETAINGFNLYKIPVTKGDVVFVNQDSSVAFFIGTLSESYAFKFQNSDDTYSVIAKNGPYGSWRVEEKKCIFFVPDGVKYFVLTAEAEYASNVKININNMFRRLNDSVSIYQTPMLLTGDNAHKSTCYKQSNSNSDFSILAGNYYALSLRIKEGDSLTFSSKVGVLTFYATYTGSDGATHNVNSPSFTATEDTFVCIFGHPDYDDVCTFHPGNGLKVDYKNIVDIPQDTKVNPFANLSGVAFGTSLTYRAQTTGGFLTKLAELSEITFDNQGIGSSSIYGNMLTAIKNYTGYSDKDICTLEGFVNDWYGNKTLGTWKDTTETSVCGCVRSALNYILSQNANITVFLILDHYGRTYGGVDCATTATNASGLTQYEYYEEIAKVAESLGIPVIKEYEVSQISENTPQFLLDNIHCNALGAIQSAYAIWSRMKDYHPNQKS